jgi:uncharacterized protein (DUF1015 family)
VPTFRPFKATRYATAAGSDISALVCPPYDVINAEERAELAARDPHNAIVVEVPAGDADTKYQAAAAILEDWRSSGVISTDNDAHLYLYDIVTPDASQVIVRGVFGQLDLEPLDTAEGTVIAHERTTPKDKTDRLTLLGATGYNLSPIWGLSLSDDLTKSLDAASDRAALLATATDAEGFVHRVSSLDAEDSRAVSQLISDDPVVIADGHHRYETSLLHFQQSNAAGANATLCLVCPLDDGLRVAAIHRVLSGVAADQIVVRLSSHFEVVEQPVGAIAAHTSTQSLAMLPRADALADAEFATDAGVLDAWLAANPDVSVRYTHRVDEVSNITADDEVGLLIRPVTADQIRDAANQRRRMPPKSTFYWPKLLTGLVFRRHADNA